MTFKEDIVTAEDAFLCLTNEGSFYKQLQDPDLPRDRWFGEYAIRSALYGYSGFGARQFLTEFRKETARLREVDRVGFEAGEQEKLLSMLVEYYDRHKKEFEIS